MRVVAGCFFLLITKIDLLVNGFDWKDIEGTYFLTSVKNFLGIPGCPSAGSVFAITSMIADRLSILQPGVPRVSLSDQILLNCVANQSTDSCIHSLPLETILQHINASDGIPDRTCMGYRAKKEECSVENTCVNCLPGNPTAHCTPRTSFIKYPISDFGEVNMELVELEIETNGPVACEFVDGSHGTLVGFRKNYFSVKRDLGVYHGDLGFDLVIKGGIKRCFQVTVNRPYRYHVPKHLLGNSYNNSIRSYARCSHRNDQPIMSKSRRRLLPIDELPPIFNWGNQSGKCLLTPMQSHHNGEGYCGACWAMASSSTFSDRLKIKRGGLSVPDVFVSPQLTVDCVKTSQSDGCNGGNAHDAFEFFVKHGSVDETCDSWLGTGERNLCSATGCTSCDAQGICSDVEDTKFTTYFASDFGHLKGEQAMMNDLFSHGPIDCGIATNSALSEDFVGDSIICDNTTEPKKWSIDHDISVVGWGEEHGLKYWVIRNSWGSHWGNNGFAKVCRGQNAPDGNMLLEKDCSWVLPKL